MRPQQRENSTPEMKNERGGLFKLTQSIAVKRIPSRVLRDYGFAFC
jgi:hypothetical protein